MNTDFIKTSVQQALVANPAIASVPVVIHTGDEADVTQQYEEALRTSGLVFVVWDVQDGQLVDSATNGAIVLQFPVWVLVDELVDFNRSGVGSATGITGDVATVEVVKALMSERRAIRTFTPTEQPVRGGGKANGVRRFGVHFNATIEIDPL